jgi:hypothetical protein
MRTGLIVIALVIASAGCERSESGKVAGSPVPGTTAPMTMKPSFQTRDFDLSLPAGWTASQSQPDRGLFTFQSPDGNTQLTLSAAKDTSVSSPANAKMDLLRVAAVRRQAEINQSKDLELTDLQVVEVGGLLIAKWHGNDRASGRRTATAVQLTKAKLFIFYVEGFGASESTLDDLAQGVASGFAAK